MKTGLRRPAIKTWNALAYQVIEAWYGARYDADVIAVLIRTLWTLPTTMVGLAVGGLCSPLGTRWQLVDGVLECYGGGVEWLLEHATLLEGGAMAITFGDVVLGRTRAALDMTRRHERVHVRQAHRWGPLFIPAYLLASLVAWVQRRGAYRGNVFEREAYAVSDGED
jgi:hypothetical protein